MDRSELQAVVAEIHYLDYFFHVIERNGICFLQAEYLEPDIITGDAAIQKTRKWHLSDLAVTSEIVQTAFKCVITSMEHRAREHFLYKGERVFGPHFDVEALVEIAKAKRLDYRKDVPVS